MSFDFRQYDGSNSQERTISIYSVTHAWQIDFFAALTDFSDSYKVNYKSQQVFGKMDPIRTYQNTERTINISLQAFAHNVGEGLHLQQKMSFLAANLYPTYAEAAGGANALLSPPYFKILLGNMVNNAAGRMLSIFNSVDEEGEATGNKLVGFGSADPAKPDFATTEDLAKSGAKIPSYNASQDGLTGVIESFDIKPVLDVGVWNFNGGDGKGFMIIPKAYDVSFDFAVIHNVKLGWRYDGDNRDVLFTETFPYGYNTNEWEEGATERIHGAQATDRTAGTAGLDVTTTPDPDAADNPGEL
jgi:hypothetical protein